jgi:hypothetical protein
MQCLKGAEIAQWYSAGLWGGWSEVRVPVGAGNFSLHHRLQTVSGGPAQRPIQGVSGAISLGVKRPGREADHSPPSSAEVKNALSYNFTPQYAFMAWCSVKAQGQLYLTFTVQCLRTAVVEMWQRSCFVHQDASIFRMAVEVMDVTSRF